MTDRRTEPATWDDVVAEAFRVTVDRAARGVASQDEGALLRRHTELLLADLARHEEVVGELNQANIKLARDLARARQEATTRPAQILDPCPRCESSSERVPRALMADHVATVHPEVQDTEPVIVCTTACDEQHLYDWTCELFAGISDEPPRTTLDNSPTSGDVADNPLEERVRAAIESELYEYRERTMWWPEGAITGEIARLATRGAMEVLGRRETDPPAALTNQENQS